MQTEPALPAAVARYRETTRAERFPERYSGPRHIALTTALSAAIIGVALSQVSSPRPAEWAVIPATFLISNLGEYLGHRGPMHHRTAGLNKVFQRHTGAHHRFFTRDAMHYASSRDFFMVLFPPVLQIFFLGGLGAPLAGLVFLLSTANAGWLFVATVGAYYYLYEILHFCHHLPTRGWMGAIPLLGRLRRHHALHHDPRIMLRANFNITFPICDLIFGTMHRGDPP